MNFECLDASACELRVSENSAESSKHAGWVCLTAYLTLKNHQEPSRTLKNTPTSVAS